MACGVSPLISFSSIDEIHVFFKRIDFSIYRQRDFLFCPFMPFAVNLEFLTTH